MKKIDAVKMVREIRDKQADDIKGKTSFEILRYYRNKALKITRKSPLSAQ